MSFFKRIFIYFIIALFVWSIRDDLTNKNIDSARETNDNVQTASHQQGGQMIEVVKRKTRQGDTVLSIAEKLHGGSIPVSAEKLITDFKIANPNVDPYHLKANQLYFFPIY